MKKIVLCLLSLFICMHSVALDNIHQSKVSNVENIRSIYAYKDPEQMKDYEQKKLVKEQTKSDKKLEEPMALFRVFVNNDRFYTDDNRYKDNVELAITSHNIDRNYIFDNEYPPYLILQDNDNNRYEIHFAKVKYDNPYWISFNLTNKEIEQINKAKTISLVLPEAQGNPVKAAHAIGADIISPYYTEISKQDVDEAHSLGMKVVPWTVNNEYVT